MKGTETCRSGADGGKLTTVVRETNSKRGDAGGGVEFREGDETVASVDARI